MVLLLLLLLLLVLKALLILLILQLLCGAFPEAFPDPLLRGREGGREGVAADLAGVAADLAGVAAVGSSDAIDVGCIDGADNNWPGVGGGGAAAAALFPCYQ
jgi:hypothetical protein